MLNKILQGSAQDKLKELESESVDCCITSPPYWALRDYKTPGQLGLEPTFTEYIQKLVEIFAEVKRVLKKTGSLWVNLGDTYAGMSAAWGNVRSENVNETHSIPKRTRTVPEKSLCCIPQRFQIAMVDAGWICRNTIIWYKPNCMPSSAKDRFTVDFEYLFFFTKSQKYYFETQYERMDDFEDYKRRMTKRYDTKYKDDGNGQTLSSWRREKKFCPIGGANKLEGYGNPTYSGNEWQPSALGRIKRCVWKIPTQPFSEAHFAVFPPAIVETPLKATCPSEGIVLDPFMGSGTVALVAMQNARNFVGIELNEEYIKMAKERLDPYLKQERLQFV